jgi:hypothetical protein
MGSPTQLNHVGSLDMKGLNRHVTVRYRCTPPNHRRVFIANSSKSVDALVINVSEDRIGLVLGIYIEPDTPVRIEMGNGGIVPYFDLASIVTQTTQLEKSKWQCDCRWVHKLTPDELLMARYSAFHLPHTTLHNNAICLPIPIQRPQNRFWWGWSTLPGTATN